MLVQQTLDVCLRMGSKDNMTTLILLFEAQKIGKGGGVEARRKARHEEENPETPKANPNPRFEY